MKLRYLYLTLIPMLCFGCGKSGESGKENNYLKTNSPSKLITNSAGSFDLYVTSNTSWKVESKNTWLVPERTSGTGSLTVKVRHEANPTEKRTGSIVLSGEGVGTVTITVTQSHMTFTNPIAKSIADPWIVKRDGYYYFCKASGNGINISRSTLLSEITGTKSVWTAPKDANGIKVWNSSNIWAPELHYIDGKWYIYYTAGRPHAESNSYNFQRGGVLRSKTDDPMGAWEDMGMVYTGDQYTNGIKPTAANTEYAIDMTVFKIKNQLYAVWSGYPGDGTSQQRLYIAKMENPYTIISNRVEISRADKPWEKVSGSINEGPAFVMNPDNTKGFLVYSCNGSYTKDYRLGYLMISNVNADPLVPASWTKSTSEVFFRCDNTSSTDGINGVGHCSLTKSPDETEDWVVYHTKNRNDGGWDSGRSMCISRFTWRADGTPDFGTPPGWGELVEVPSGEVH